jgi:hypothetical protein
MKIWYENIKSFTHIRNKMDFLKSNLHFYFQEIKHLNFYLKVESNADIQWVNFPNAIG